MDNVEIKFSMLPELEQKRLFQQYKEEIKDVSNSIKFIDFLERNLPRPAKTEQSRGVYTPPPAPRIKTFEELVEGYIEEHDGCKRSEAIKAIVESHPEAHRAYLEKANIIRTPIEKPIHGFEQLCEITMVRERCSKATAIKQVAADNPELHEDYLESIN